MTHVIVFKHSIDREVVGTMKRKAVNDLDAFLRGVARNADFYRSLGSFIVDKQSYAHDDVQSLQSDWMAIGNDMKGVMKNERFSK